jgi:hypothetical protein
MGEPARNASPYRRIFGDLRLQLHSENAGADSLRTQFDARYRRTNRSDIQSGFRGGADEVDLREAFVRYGDLKALTLGRQRIAAFDANKVDGLSYLHKLERVSLIAFGGMLPTRGSRSLRHDYPRGHEESVASGRRIAPATLGFGANYAKATLHGNAGLGAIIPFRPDGMDESRQSTTIVLHSSGYWRAAPRTTLYHYATGNLEGDSPTLQNMSAGISQQGQLSLRLSANHHSTEVLRESVVTQIDDAEGASTGLVMNGLSIARVSSQSLRLAASLAALQNRLQFTLRGGVQQRPEVEFRLSDDSLFALPATRNAEVGFVILDRRSVLGLRASAQLTYLQAIGESTASSSGIVASTELSREVWSGADLAIDAAMQRMSDNGEINACVTAEPWRCYGASSVFAVQVGAQLVARSAPHWLFLLDAHWGIEKVKSQDIMSQAITYPNLMSLTGYARVQYSFR